MKSSNISVIIPLYNKERTVARALESVAAQSLPPLDITVVDDGSTDGSAAVVEAFAAAHPALPLRLVRQANAGVSVARNRAIAESRGEFAALLDADDRWTPDHLAVIERLAAEHPECGLFATAFRVDDGRRITDGECPSATGVVDFFAAALRGYAVIPSAAVLRRSVFDATEGFPAGMKMGEDQYMWICMARLSGVCLSPARTAIYSKAADNRSSAIYTAESCSRSFGGLLAEASSDDEREYIARAALGKALVQSARGGTEEAARALYLFGFTRRNRRALRKLRVVNALPLPLRAPFLRLYNSLAWAIARKGL